METKRITINIENLDSDAIKEAASIVDSGGLVAFPTETVYGIAARVKNNTLSKLNIVKGRPKNKHYTLHIADNNDVLKYVPNIPLRTRKLIQNAWPGPLTIVFALEPDEVNIQQTTLGKETFSVLYKDGTIGVRCPDNPVATALLKEIKCAVVAPSANISNQPPAINADQVLEQLDGKIDMVLDAGQCQFRKSSTVVRIDNRVIEILREGAYSKMELDMLSQIKVLFVCTGNTCRSPMAEGVFKKYLAEKLNFKVDELEQMGYKVSSAGIIGSSGHPATPEAVAACASQGVDIGNHRNQGLTRELIEESDFIFTMEKIHLLRTLMLTPDAKNRCLLLAGNKEILDPIGQPQRIYDNCVKIITKAVKERISELIT
ncbi:MAG: threonylcarbamoyl-AMP synthase [Sedimentisphaerales bacterium]|nr:threonylcarbamoyl-AMP synthase [Sedimentisphaerales bacterium]